VTPDKPSNQKWDFPTQPLRLDFSLTRPQLPSDHCSALSRAYIEILGFEKGIYIRRVPCSYDLSSRSIVPSSFAHRQFYHIQIFLSVKPGLASYELFNTSMSATTVADFGAKTEASAVASTFPASIKGRTILITGVNKLGVGYAIAQALASQSPRRIIISGRSQAKLQECLDSIRPQYLAVDFRSLVVDLSSQKSVRNATAELLGWEDTPAIDVVVNNAGIMSIPERTFSEDGIELHMATNYVGHFLFTNLIMLKIIAAAKSAHPGAARIINVSSIGTLASPFRASDINWEKPTSQLPEKERPNLAMMKSAGIVVDEETSYIPMGAYAQSKTANILYSVALNEKLYEKYGVLSLALHPGEIRTELHRTTDLAWLEKTEEWREKMGVEWKTLEQGASTTLVAALDPKLGKPNSNGYGQFLNDCQISNMPPPYALDKAEAEKLWDATEVMVKEKFSW
jgi:NAD(P)-dependent dehydrogenase (short-subunit alcohol dehydrogenase family)